jgi:hypothetical protein
VAGFASPFFSQANARAQKSLKTNLLQSYTRNVRTRVCSSTQTHNNNNNNNNNNTQTQLEAQPRDLIAR